MRFSEILSEIFCPCGIKCIVCSDEVFDDSRYSLCEKCALPINDNFCLACGKGILDMADFCDHCKERSCHFTMARAPLLYDESIHGMVHRLKYGGAKYLAEYFAKIMYDVFITYDWKIDVVTFVPMHKKKLKERGYNQGELIAKAFAKESGLQLDCLLEKIKYTKNLAKMNRKEREEAIKDSFAPKKGKTPPASILLIDDVMTTSSTSNECALTLKKAGALKIYVLTLATSRVLPELY